MRRGVQVALVVVAVVTAVLGGVLLAHERGGPSHRDVMLPGNVPATFYRPEGVVDPPAVVVGHGYSGDRATMSSLARSIAAAEYAVLAIDFRGHGANPNGFGEGDRAEDLLAALDWLEASPEVDGDRLAVLAHSMGAHAALDVAVRDPRPDATVVLGSAHHPVLGTTVPRNVLLLAGGNEWAPVVEVSNELARDLERAGAATRYAEIEGANHMTILWFDETVAEAVAWLDEAFGVERAEPAGIDDPRLPIAVAYLLCAVVVFAALGLLTGKVVARSPEEPPAGLRELALLAIALGAAAPVSVFFDPAGFLGTGFGDVVSYLAVAGVVLYLLRLRGRGAGANHPTGWMTRAALGAAAALAGLFLLLAPMGGVTHRLVPTVQRTVLLALMAPLLGVFFVQLQAILRRGSLLRAAAGSGAGHAAVLLALAAGVVVDVFPGVVGLALPLLAGVFGLVEVFGFGAYATARSGAFVGIVEALWVAGIAAVAMPLPW